MVANASMRSRSMLCLADRLHQGLYGGLAFLECERCVQGLARKSLARQLQEHFAVVLQTVLREFPENAL
jgi:hypothetical protein